jgi:UDP-N-acetylmuramoyl-tripeptide--D-alanyl-D-alanine ligase
MVRPHVAIVTTVEPVHIEHFRSVQGIADAKGEIFAGIEPGGVAVINRDNPHFERLRAHALASPAGSVLTFGEHEAADVRAERIALHPDASMVDARVLGRPIAYRLGAPGRHIAMNSLSILAVAHALGLDVAEVAGGLADVEAPVGRGQRTQLRLPGGSATLIDESYNANPASMRAALATLAAAGTGPGGRRIAVMGDMLELGPDAAALHRGLSEPVAESGVDLVFAAGALMRNLAEALPPGRLGGYAGTAAELIDAVLGGVGPGDVVMIKGSNSTRMSQIVQALKDMSDAGQSARSSRG